MRKKNLMIIILQKNNDNDNDTSNNDVTYDNITETILFRNIKNYNRGISRFTLLILYHFLYLSIL